MYLIPKEMNSKSKIFKDLHMKEFFIVIVGMGMVFLFKNLVYPKLTIPYYICSAISIIFLVAPASFNPGKNNYHAIYYSFIKNTGVFHSISIDEINKGSEK